MAWKPLIGFLLLGFLASHAPSAKAARILAAFPYPVKSDFVMYSAIVGELVQRGHKVTMITGVSLKSLNFGENYDEVLIEPVFSNWTNVNEKFEVRNQFQLSLLKFQDTLRYNELLGLEITEHALKDAKVQKIINAPVTDKVYDLLLTSQFYQEAFLALGYKYNIPVVTTSTYSHATYMAQITGLVVPWAAVPNPFMNHSDTMNFLERVENACASAYQDYYREYVYFPKMDALVQKYFSHLPLTFPSVSKMEKNVSLILLNSHSSIASLHSNADMMIPIGGIHIKPPKALSEDLQRFLDEASEGVIYFNLGSNLKSSDLPIAMQQIFRNVFAQLKQRVLWKFENSTANFSPNVLTKKWLPQTAVLAHPNVKVFITHGGLFSLQEGVHQGVPMLGLPAYYDQHMNMKKAAQDGYAIALDFKSFNENSLLEALQHLLQDAKYSQSAKEKSSLFKDRPMSPQDSAVYWIEYAVRTKGAHHLKPAGLAMSWFTYYMVDIATFVGVLLLGTAIVWGGVVRLMYSDKMPKQKTN